MKGTQARYAPKYHLLLSTHKQKLISKRQTNKQKIWKIPKAKMTGSVQIGLLEKAQKVPGPQSCCGAKITGELTQPPESQLGENGLGSTGKNWRKH